MTQFSIHWILSLNRLSQKWGQVHPETGPVKLFCRRLEVGAQPVELFQDFEEVFDRSGDLV